MSAESLQHAVNTQEQFLALLPRFEAALDATSSFYQNRTPDLATVRQLRLNAQAYTDLPATYFTLDITPEDNIYSVDELSEERLRKLPPFQRQAPVPGYRLDLPVTEPFRHEILFSTAWFGGEENQMVPTYKPRIYIGIGLSALRQRVLVCSGKQRLLNPKRLRDKA